jgi:hypothetical protein
VHLPLTFFRHFEESRRDEDPDEGLALQVLSLGPMLNPVLQEVQYPLAGSHVWQEASTATHCPLVVFK